MVQVIAEIGVNHNGSINLAKHLINESARCGVNFVKFQTFVASRVISEKAPKLEYQKVSGAETDNVSQLEMLQKLELSYFDHLELVECAKKSGTTFISTPKDQASADLLEALDVPLYKIGSGDLMNFPLLEHIGKKNKPIYLSTGMATLKEISAAVKVIEKTPCPALSLFHCVSAYPAPDSQLNLNAIKTLKKEFSLPVGYSDHSIGIDAAIYAVAMGASIIEKHVTLDKKLEGPDHKASITFAELKSLMDRLSTFQLMIGDGSVEPQSCEILNRQLFRRGLYYNKSLANDHIITIEDIDVKRPASGLLPSDLDRVLTRRLRHGVEKGQLVEPKDFDD